MSEGSQVSKVAVCVQILKIPIKFLQVKIATVKKCMAFCPIWLCLQEICHMYLLPPMHLPLNCEKKRESIPCNPKQLKLLKTESQ